MPSSASEVPSPERTDQVEVSQCDYTLAFLVFTAYLSFQENRRFLLVPRVVLNPLVSLIGRLVAYSARISVDTTHSTADTNQASCNLRCACAPRGHAGARAHHARFIVGPGSEGLNTLLSQERSRVVNSEMAEGKDGVNKES